MMSAATLKACRLLVHRSLRGIPLPPRSQTHGRLSHKSGVWRPLLWGRYRAGSRDAHDGKNRGRVPPDSVPPGAGQRKGLKRDG